MPDEKSEIEKHLQAIFFLVQHDLMKRPEDFYQDYADLPNPPLFVRGNQLTGLLRVQRHSLASVVMVRDLLERTRRAGGDVYPLARDLGDSLNRNKFSVEAFPQILSIFAESMKAGNGSYQTLNLLGNMSPSVQARYMPVLIPHLAQTARAGYDPYPLSLLLTDGLKCGAFSPAYLSTVAPPLRELLEQNEDSRYDSIHLAADLGFHLRNKQFTRQHLPALVPVLTQTARTGINPSHLLGAIGGGLKRGHLWFKRGWLPLEELAPAMKMVLPHLRRDDDAGVLRAVLRGVVNRQVTAQNARLTVKQARAFKGHLKSV